jgi:DNA-binding NarL/FixJ family response regulator
MKPVRKIRLMLVDDHFVVRAGLAGSLGLDPEMQIVAECGTGEEALAAYRKHQPDVVLMDWRLPGISGVEAAAQIRAEFPDACILQLTIYEGDEDIFRAAEAGVRGYLPKSVSRRELLAAIRAVHRGEEVFPAAIKAKLDARRARPELNEREKTVLKLIVNGRSNKEIASDLGIAEVTVKFHVGNLLAKLGVQDRTQATTAAIQRGIVHLD